MTTTRIQFQRLLDVVKATEIQYTTKFNMSWVVCDIAEAEGSSSTECGTVGCLIGNYNLMAGRYSQLFGDWYNPEAESKDWEYFGITEREYNWLFMMGAEYPDYEPPKPASMYRVFYNLRNLDDVTKEQALARLRKFIYWKLHKEEMLYDDNGVREEARRAEGNQLFAARAVAESGPRPPQDRQCEEAMA